MSDYREVSRFYDTREYPPWLDWFEHNQREPPPQRVMGLSWSPDSKRIAGAYLDFAVRVWNLNGSFDVPEKGFGHTKYVTSVSWSPMGDKIASGDTQADPVRVWDVESGIEIRTLWGHNEWPLSVDWSPSGRYLMSCSATGGIILWDIEADEPNHRFYVHVTKGHIMTVRWNHQKYKVAAVVIDDDGNDRKVLIFDTRNWQIQHQVRLANALAWYGTYIDWSPNGQYLAVLGDDTHIHIWEPSKNDAKETAILKPISVERPEYNNNSQGISWNSDGHRIACVNGTNKVYLWEDGVPQPSIYGTEDDSFQALQWSPDGQFLAVGDMEGIVRVFSKV